MYLSKTVINVILTGCKDLTSRCPTRRSARARVTARCAGAGAGWPGRASPGGGGAWCQDPAASSHTEVPGSLHTLTRSGMGWSWVFSHLEAVGDNSQHISV